LTEAIRRLRDDDLPLLLCLVWSEMFENVLDRKQFVLKETRADAVEVCRLFTLSLVNNALCVAILLNVLPCGTCFC